MYKRKSYGEMKAEVLGYFIGKRKRVDYEGIIKDLDIDLRTAHRIVTELRNKGIIKPSAY